MTWSSPHLTPNDSPHSVLDLFEYVERVNDSTPGAYVSRLPTRQGNDHWLPFLA